jgi:hypothetical protein
MTGDNDYDRFNYGESSHSHSRKSSQKNSNNLKS